MQHIRVKELIEQGKTTDEIVTLIGCYKPYISYIRKRYSLPPAVLKDKINWIELQKYYDDGHGLRETAEYFKIAKGRVLRGASTGKLITRSRSNSILLYNSKHDKRVISDDHKKRLREARILYMQQHPEKTAWSRRWKHEKSWPEKIFEDELNRQNITGWVYNYQSGIYEYDFGFLDLKIDVEIDGEWHNTDKQRQKDSLRDEYTLNNGWIVIRFTAKDVNKDVSKCVTNLKILIEKLTSRVNGSPTDFDSVT
jgi:very-short-patch-repair endonuclease